MRHNNDFDPVKAQALLAYIRQGGFPGVAADAAGVPRPLFLAWVRRGERSGAREPLRSFARDVRQAIAQARLLSELAVCKKDPKFWLSHGPGRETAELVGWTTPVRPKASQVVKEDPIETCRELCSWVMEALTPYPEARVKLAEQLAANPPPAVVEKKQSGFRSAFGAGSAGPPFGWSGFDPSLN